MLDDVIKKIQDNYSYFSSAQTQIADVILNEPTCLALMTSADLAKKAQVSEATTVRFATALGYSGYSELRKAVQSEMMENRTLVKLQESLNRSDDEKSDYLAFMEMDIANIQLTMSHLNTPDLDLAVDQICKAKRVFILGRKRTSSLASYMEFILNLLLDQTLLLDDTANILESITDINEGDCIFAIGFKRYSKETVQVFQHFKKRGAFCIALTDSNTSPLTKIADVFFRVETSSLSFMDSYTAAMSLINGIWSKIARKNAEKSKKKLQVLEDLFKDADLFY